MSQKFPLAEFSTRRKKLLDLMKKNSLAVIFASPHLYRNSDVHYLYRPSSNFYYLSGFAEPDAVLILTKTDNSSSFILFNQPSDPLAECWNGKRAGQKKGITLFGADKCYPIKDFPSQFEQLVIKITTIYWNFSHSKQIYTKQEKWFMKNFLSSLTACSSPPITTHLLPQEFIALNPLLNSLRCIKSPYEQKIMKKAARISVKAHKKAMKTARPLIFEYTIEAQLMKIFYENGSRYPAYPNIVASGPNTCTLHYIDNNRLIANGDLILLDAGCEYQYYAADITTTFPANGKFSSGQKIIYEIVLNAHNKALNLIKPGLEWRKIHQQCLLTITEGLIKIGLLSGTIENNLKKKNYQRFFMHGSGHWLGLDVHDVGQYTDEKGSSCILKPGMVFTLEPGIYIPDHQSDFDSRWWNIGVRIEDNILVTNTGYEVLTAGLPRTVEEIENFMQ